MGGVMEVLRIAAFGDGDVGLWRRAVAARPSRECKVVFGGIVQRKVVVLYSVSGLVGCGHITIHEIVGDGVGDNIPLGVEGDVSSRRIGITSIADALLQLFIAIPAAEGVAGLDRLRQGDAAVRPLGIESDGGAIGSSEVVDVLLVVINLRTAGRRCPAVEGGGGRCAGMAIATHGTVVVIGHGKGAGESVGGEVLRYVVGEALAGHRATRFAVAVEGDVVGDGCPLGVEGHRAAVGSGEVFDALTVGIGGAVAVGLGVPACKGVARAGEGVGLEVLRCAVGKGLVSHGACSIGVVLVELHGVGVVWIFGGDGHVTVGTVHGVGIAAEGVVAGLVNDVLARGDIAAERDGGVRLIVFVTAVGEIGCGAERYAAGRRHLIYLGKRRRRADVLCGHGEREAALVVSDGNSGRARAASALNDVVLVGRCNGDGRAGLVVGRAAAGGRGAAGHCQSVSRGDGVVSDEGDR